MTGKIISLDQWRADHPPAVRLANIMGHCWLASWRLWFAILRSYGPR